MTETTGERQNTTRVARVLASATAAASVGFLVGCWAFWRGFAQVMKQCGHWEPLGVLDAQAEALDALSERLGSQARAVALLHQTIGRRLDDSTPPDSAVAVAARRWLATPMQQTQHGREDNPVEQSLTPDDWQEAAAHFFATMRRYQDLMGAPTVVVGPALLVTFEPLARRYQSGERTRELYDAMLAVEQGETCETKRRNRTGSSPRR